MKKSPLKNANYSVTMVNHMSATSTCISHIIWIPYWFFVQHSISIMSWENTNTEKFYQATIILIKYTCLIHFKKDLKHVF